MTEKYVDEATLEKFLSEYTELRHRHSSVQYLWTKYFFALTPASFVMTTIIMMPLGLLALINNRVEASICLFGLVLIEYFLGYYPYFRELPTPARIKAHVRGNSELLERYEAAKEKGTSIAKEMDIGFSEEGYFYEIDTEQKILLR